MEEFLKFFDWLRQGNNAAATGLIVTVALAVFGGLWALWNKYFDRKNPGGGEKAPTPLPPTPPEGDQLTIQSLVRMLETKEEEIRELRAKGSDDPTIDAELAEVGRRKADPQTALAKRKADLAEISTDIAKIDDLPPEKLHQAQTALKAGRTTEAETLLAEVEQEEAEGVERAAQAAYLRGEIAEEDIRWADAAAHYTRAANLAANYDRLKKAREFIWRAGDYAGAVASGEALIATAAAEFGEDSEKHATALNEHALTLHDTGAHEQAEPLFRDAIEIGKSTIGKAHPDYATRLNNLANLLYDMGQYKEAEPLYREAIDIAKETIGEAHPNYATSLINLSNLLRVMGRYREAEPLCRQAIEIGKVTIGETHPEYATGLNNLASILRAMGRYEEAEPLYRQAIEIDKATIGEAHPAYATRLNNLAGLLEDMGRYEEAEPLYRQAIEIDKATIGEAHPEYAIGLNNLAGLLRAMGRHEEAEPLYRQMIAIWRETLGDDHPNTRKGSANYARFLRQHHPASPDLTDLIAAFGDDIGR